MNPHAGAGKARSLEEQHILLIAELFPGSSVGLERFQEGGRAMPPPQLQFVPVSFHPIGISVMSPLSLAVMLSWP